MTQDITNNRLEINKMRPIPPKEFYNLAKKLDKLEDKLKILTEEVNDVKESNLLFRKKIREKNFQKKDIYLDLRIYTLIMYSTSRFSYEGYEEYFLYPNRLRIAFMLIVLFGLQIGQLPFIRIYQVKPLFDKSFYYRKFLTSNGVKLIENREKDFNIIVASQESRGFIFPAFANPLKPLRREKLSRLLNQCLKHVLSRLNRRHNGNTEIFPLTTIMLKSAFRNQLWLDIEQIEVIQNELFG